MQQEMTRTMQARDTEVIGIGTKRSGREAGAMEATEITMVMVTEVGLEKAQMNRIGDTKGVGLKEVDDQVLLRGREWKMPMEDGMIDMKGSAPGLLREGTIESIALVSPLMVHDMICCHPLQ